MLDDHKSLNKTTIQ